MVLRDLRRGGHWPSLVAAFVYFDVSFMVWLLIGSLGPYLAADLGLSPAAKGVVVAVPVLGGAVFRVLLGTLGDHVGLRRVGLAALAVTTVPLLWGALGGGSLAQLLGIGVLLGVAGASFAVAVPLAARWYPPQSRGLVSGLVGAGNSGTVVGALVAPLVAEHVGWHGAFGAALAPVTAAFVVFAALAKEPPRGGSPSRPLTVARQPDARFLAGIYAVTFGGFVGLTTFLPVLLVDRFGLTKLTAATVAAACAAGGSVLRPIGGGLADRRGGAVVLAIVLALASGGAVVAAIAPGLVVTSGALGLLLALLGLGNGAVFQLVPERFPADVGSVTGLVGAAGGIGGFVVPILLGSSRQVTGSFVPAFVVLAAIALAAGWATRLRLLSPRAWRGASDEPALEVAA